MPKVKNIFQELDQDLAEYFGQVPNESPEEFTERLIGELHDMFKEDKKW